MEDAGSLSENGGVTVGYKPVKLATTLYRHDPQHSNVGIRDRVERPKGLEGGDVKAAEPGTPEVYWGSLWVFRRKSGENCGS